MSDRKVYVIQLRTGEYCEEYDYYVLSAYRTRDDADRAIELAMRMYKDAYSDIEKPPWNDNLIKLEKYEKACLVIEKRLIKEYMKMFPSLCGMDDLCLEGGVDFSVYEVPLV